MTFFIGEPFLWFDELRQRMLLLSDACIARLR